MKIFGRNGRSAGSRRGTGIWAEQQAYAFWLLDEPGAGAGLTISRRIAERRGGRLWVRSVPEHGTMFYFTV